MADATRSAVAAKGSPQTAKRGRLSERAWADVRHAAKVAREEGVTLKVHGIEVTGLLKQHTKVPRKSCKVLQKPAETAATMKPSAPADDSSSPAPLSKRKERSAQRLLEFQKKKRAELFAKKSYGNTQKGITRHELKYQKQGHHPALACAKLRWLLWRAWARYRPIFGGVVLGYTSLREQYVYQRAAKLYAAAFSLDPGKSGRPLAAWLRHATPMESETASVASSVGSQPSKRAKKSRGKPRASAVGGV